MSEQRRTIYVVLTADGEEKNFKESGPAELYLADLAKKWVHAFLLMKDIRTNTFITLLETREQGDAMVIVGI